MWNTSRKRTQSFQYVSLQFVEQILRKHLLLISLDKINTMSSIDTWVSDKLHDILGISDKYISQYLIALCKKSSSSDGFVEKLKETGTVDIDSNMVNFAKELWERVIEIFYCSRVTCGWCLILFTINLKPICTIVWR